MAGQESDLLFGNLPPPYRAMPTSPNIEDRRTGSVDYAARMRNSGEFSHVGDSMLRAAFAGNPNAYGLNYNPGHYYASFNRDFSPPPQAPTPISHPSGALPYLAPHDPMSPTAPDWDPHGYAPSNSAFTPEEMNSALQFWRTGQ
jgi:hypothetical protein